MADSLEVHEDVHGGIHLVDDEVEYLLAQPGVALGLSARDDRRLLLSQLPDLLLSLVQRKRRAENLRSHGRTDETWLYYKGFYDQDVVLGHVSLGPFDESF